MPRTTKNCVSLRIEFPTPNDCRVISRVDEFLSRPDRPPYMVWGQCAGGEGYEDFKTFDEAKAKADEINSDELECASVYGPDGTEVYTCAESCESVTGRYREEQAAQKAAKK